MSPKISADIPVVNVLLTEDRGTIVRRGVVDWPGGSGTVVVDGLAPVLVDASMQPTVDVGEIGKCIIHRSWQQTDLSEMAETAQQRKDLRDQLLRNVAHQHRHQRRVDAMFKTYIETIAATASANQGEVSVWAENIASLHERRIQRGDVTCSVQADLNEVERAFKDIQASLETLRGQWHLTARVEIALDAGEGPVNVSLQYVVPAAMWRPTYRAALRGDTVTLTAQATLWQRTGEDWPAVNIALSTARPSTGAHLPPLYTDRLQLRDKTAEERRVIQAQTWSQSVQQTALTENEGLPGVDDGGETRELATAQPMAIPSTGRPHRATVTEESVTAVVEYRCYPAQSTHVYRVAEFTNPLPHPLLAGPVTLVADGGPCGTGEIPFVAEGEAFSLSFGSADEVSVDYKRTTETEDRLMATDHKWFIQEVVLTNTGGEDITTEVVMRTPVSELAQVKVIVDTEERSSKNMTGPDEQGHVRWTVTVPSMRQTRRKLAFRVEKKSNVQLPDFW